MRTRVLLHTLEDVFETYRMLGHEREAELLREATRLQRAAAVRHSHPRRSLRSAPLALAQSLLPPPFVSTTRREQKPA